MLYIYHAQTKVLKSMSSIEGQHYYSIPIHYSHNTAIDYSGQLKPEVFN